MTSRKPSDRLDALGERMFRAARAEAPSARARQRARRAFSAGLAAASGVSASEAAAVQSAVNGAAAPALGAKATSGGFLSSLGLYGKVVVPLVVTGIAAVSIQHLRPADEPVSVTAERTHEVVRKPPTAPTAIVPVEKDPPQPAPVATPDDSLTRPPRPNRTKAARAREPHKEFSLAEEISELDQARRELLAGDGAQSLRRLNEYRTRFGAGHLGSEATALRIEAMAKQGNRSGALSLARSFISAHPNDPLVDRVRSSIASLENGHDDDAPAVRRSADAAASD